MTISPEVMPLDLDTLKEQGGTLAVFAKAKGGTDRALRKVNTLARGQVNRVLDSEAFEKAPAGSVHTINVPFGLAVEAVLIVKLGETPTETDLRKIGAKLVTSAKGGSLNILMPKIKSVSEVVKGAMLRTYAFNQHKSKSDDTLPQIFVHSDDTDGLATDMDAAKAEVAGVHFTRDLVNEPSNILTTTEFANRLTALTEHGLTVKVLEEPELASLGMGALLGVGQGSESPSKVVVMEHMGGGDEAPLALVGKGVVFDTGGISLKPAGGMEDMTMDMGGAGVVSGVMKTLAMRKAKANVVGLVGLVENMPDGKAQRPGDVVTSMKGDTIEVINTDAEGRLVLADVLWYAQETYNPSGIVDLATLTGAIIVGLGHENAGVFSNHDDFVANFLTAASEADEGAWRMPLGDAYDELIKSQFADMKNVGGRTAGSITAAQFLLRFIKDDMPWIHLDIAGTASVKTSTSYAPKGATGWGVRALNHMVAKYYEG
ncbi:MAG: leucyl aminopeptidase [Pseudomonadota bacterium]